MKKKFGAIYALFLVFGLFLSACGGSGGSGSAEITAITSENQVGALSIGLTDATADEFLAVYITVKEVSVSQSVPGDSADESGSSWVLVAEPNITCNLLELVNGVIEHLGISEDIIAGHYNQMRLVLGTTPQEVQEGEEANILGDPEHPFANYIVYGDDETFVPENTSTFDIYELKIPSGSESGFKIVGGFDIDPDGTTDLVLDFNVVSSIVHAGESGQWLLNPTVKALDLDESGTVSGIVYYMTTDEEPSEETIIEGAIIKAQDVSDGSVTGIVSAATVSDESGGYLLNLDPGTYMIAAIAPGFKTATVEVTVATASSVEQDFEMMLAGDETGTIYGTVNIMNGLSEQFVTVYILDGNGVAIDEKSIANGGTYWFDLSPGTYSMTAVFTCNGEEMTLEAYKAFDVAGGQAEEFDILFENVEEGDGEMGANAPEKVTICHKGKKNITISSSALQAHLNHGDTEGTCGTVEEETTETEGEETSGEEAETETETEEVQNKVAVCHKGKTIYVSSSALNAHLAHGDSEGVCGEAD